MTQSPVQITVEVDLYVTRRNRVHQVRNDNMEAIFYAKSVGDLLRWLYENGHHTFMVIDDESRFQIALSIPRALPHPSE